MNCRIILVLLLFVSADSKASSRPNIILLMSDDQAWADTGYAGFPGAVTPNLDAMAANGLRLDRFYVACPKCSSSRAAVLTGRQPHRFRFFNGSGFPKTEKTIAEVLRGVGYLTVHIGKWHLGKVEADDPANPARRGFDHYRSSPNFFECDPVFRGEDGKLYQQEGDGSVACAKLALGYLRESQIENKPIFAVIWFGSPHGPLDPHPVDLEAVVEDSKKRGKGVEYLAEIHGIDRAIGLLRSGIRDLGIEKNTLVVFCADNGIKSDHGGLRGGKENLWEGGVRVPAVAEWPGRIAAGRVTHIPASSLDLAPTAAALAGIRDLTMSGPVDGIDLTSLFDDTMSSRPKPIPLAYFGCNALVSNRFKILLGDPNCKKHVRPGFPDSVDTSGPWHFFDLNNDSGETVDVSKEFPTEFQKLQSQLKEWLQGAR